MVLYGTVLYNRLSGTDACDHKGTITKGLSVRKLRTLLTARTKGKLRVGIRGKAVRQTVTIRTLWQ